jgi:hypothetical protein
MKHMFASFGGVKNTSYVITCPQQELAVLVNISLLKQHCTLTDHVMMRTGIYSNLSLTVY